MATAGKISSTPSFFNFLKEGLLLPSHNRRLFAAVSTIVVASTCLLLLGNNLAVRPLIIQPLMVKVDLDTKALNSTVTDPTSSPDILRQLIRKTQHDTGALLLTSTADFLFVVIIRSAIHIVVLFAAVSTYSGELHYTIRSLLGKVKAQLKGPVLTLAFVYALETAYVALLLVMSTLVMVLMIMKYFGLFFVGSLLLLAPFIFLVYFSFLCSLSVVVAVAEPGCHGAGALGRAWRLVKGKRIRAMLFVFVTGLLGAALTPLYNLSSKTCALGNMAAGLLLGFLYVILSSAVQLFAACAMTAFYYECKGSTEASAVEYVKVSTKEQVDA